MLKLRISSIFQMSQVSRGICSNLLLPSALLNLSLTLAMMHDMCKGKLQKFWSIRVILWLHIFRDIGADWIHANCSLSSAFFTKLKILDLPTENRIKDFASSTTCKEWNILLNPQKLRNPMQENREACFGVPRLTYCGISSEITWGTLLFIQVI